MNYTLLSPRDADEHLARLFDATSTCEISVQEEVAFDNGWLDLGSIKKQKDGDLKHGAYHWSITTLAEARLAFARLLPSTASRKTDRIIDAIVAIAVRTGLIYPRFDPLALEAMPFKRSTTVVADTSGVLQGGLDFVARYLHPAARVKIPAIVQMEIVNFSHRFLSTRRAKKDKARPDVLLDHMKSQGGQRALLRLELHTETELERTFLLGDPLRSAFVPDRDKDLENLNLNTSLDAYADRLILETARHHQAQSNLGHKVQLLTSDQGLARMALAEGLHPLYFQMPSAEEFFGSLLPGVRLSPFKGEFEAVSLTGALWEFATAFGCCRIQSAAGSIIIAAFGEDLPWSPFQSQSDLLWLKVAFSGTAPQVPPVAPVKVDQTDLAPLEEAAQPDLRTPPKAVSAWGVQILNIPRLIQLVTVLDDHQALKIERVSSIVNSKNKGGLAEYRRFLSGFDAIQISGDQWLATGTTKNLAIALRNLDVDGLRASLDRSPSVHAMVAEIAATPLGSAWNSNRFQRGQLGYGVIAQLLQVAAPVVPEGLLPTPANPTVHEFADLALRRFGELDHGDGLVATGVWLEELVRKDGIHPERVRALLQEASAANKLRRTLEGSTSDVKHDDHNMQVIRLKNAKPVIETVFLYRGDYLIPGTSGSSLRIEKGLR